MTMLFGLIIVFSISLAQFQVHARDVCQYYEYANRTTTRTITCRDDCCTSGIADSSNGVCCSNVSWISVLITFLLIGGICLIAVCILCCRPVWKTCLCGHKCPCGNRSRVSSPVARNGTTNSVFVINNDDLPDYETIVKDSPQKDLTPPAYAFVTENLNQFNVEANDPSAPPLYQSRPNSAASANRAGSARY